MLAHFLFVLEEVVFVGVWVEVWKVTVLHGPEIPVGELVVELLVEQLHIGKMVQPW